MTDLQPHSRNPQPAASLLTAGARFIRGFTRVGSIVAVLIALIGVPTTVFIAIDRSNSAASAYQSAKCIAGLARSGYTFKKKYEYSSAVDYGVGGCTDYYHSYSTVSDVVAIADSPAPTFLSSEGASVLGWGLVITGLVAVAAYLAFWAIGWLCAGFTRDA
jgi:hypothetical protein